MLASQAVVDSKRLSRRGRGELPTRNVRHSCLVTEKKKFNAQAIVKSGLNKAVDSQYPLAVENVARLRRVHPEKSPEQLISYLNTIYLAAVTTTGAGAGAGCLMPPSRTLEPGVAE